MTVLSKLFFTIGNTHTNIIVTSESAVGGFFILPFLTFALKHIKSAKFLIPRRNISALAALLHLLSSSNCS